jgi:hypothetical protein
MMEYTGNLYGKIGRRHIPLKLTAADVDQLEHDRKKLQAIEDAALKIIPGYGKTGLSDFTTPVSVMYRLRDEVDALRKELESAHEKAIDWFITAQEVRDAAGELVAAKGRFHTQRAYEKLQAILAAHPTPPTGDSH